jgi:hypothetical protein
MRARFVGRVRRAIDEPGRVRGGEEFAHRLRRSARVRFVTAASLRA